MKVFGFAGRVLIVAIVCATGTLWLGWMVVPVAGFVYGLLDRGGRARGSIAAIGAVLAWTAILGAAAARGADVRAVAERLGAVMQIPALAFFGVTLIFAAILCGAAAVLGLGARDALTRQFRDG